MAKEQGEKDARSGSGQVINSILSAGGSRRVGVNSGLEWRARSHYVLTKLPTVKGASCLGGSWQRIGSG